MSNELQFARTSNGFVIRVSGFGTMKTSPAFREMAEQCLSDNAEHVVVDLMCCEYLDSTFLGCLIQVHKRYRDFGEARFQIIADDTKRTKLFSTSMLDRLLDFVSDHPAVNTEFVSLPANELETEELGLHVMRCHQRLAELCGKDADKYRSIADRLAKSSTSENSRRLNTYYV